MEMPGTTPISSANGASAPAAPRDPALEKAAKAFEAIFLRQMIGAMRSSSLSEGIFDSSATEQFRDMADSRTADEMAKTSKFGIADLLMRQFAPKVPLTPASVGTPAAKGDGQ
tara:strand:+ start:182981 stop:183319 length:339 start_codon:yes stop_codon:yes gene_type:complete